VSGSSRGPPCCRRRRDGCFVANAITRREAARRSKRSRPTAPGLSNWAIAWARSLATARDASQQSMRRGATDRAARGVHPHRRRAAGRRCSGSSEGVLAELRLLNPQPRSARRTDLEAGLAGLIGEKRHQPRIGYDSEYGRYTGPRPDSVHGGLSSRSRSYATLCAWVRPILSRSLKTRQL
jgi:hypothetical protein